MPLTQSQVVRQLNRVYRITIDDPVSTVARAVRNRRGLLVEVFLKVLEAAPSQRVRVHELRLDGAGADERDLDDQVIEAARLEPGQGVHLRAALHLKDADRIGAAEIVVHGLVGHVEPREVDRLAARPANVLDAELDQRQHAQS